MRNDAVKKPENEYLVIADQTSEILISTTSRAEALNLIQYIRRGGGSVTLFVATED